MPITLTPTKQDGSAAKSTELVYVEPDQAVTDADLDQQVGVDGMNGPFLADLLSACLTHERCGVHLYRSVAGRTNNPVLKRKYEEFGRQTLRHVEILEELVTASGGNPAYVSPMARAVEGSDAKVLEATYASSGSLDPMAEEMAMLDAVLLAETIDHANWEGLAQLADALPDGKVRKALRRAVEQVEPEEDEHLGWAKRTRLELTMLQASSKRTSKAMAKVEELVGQVKGWFRGGDGSRDGASATGRGRGRPATAPTVAEKADERGGPAKKRAPAEKAATKKAATKRSAPTKKAPAKKSAPAKKAPAKKAPARKAPARKTTAKKTTARRR